MTDFTPRWIAQLDGWTWTPGHVDLQLDANININININNLNLSRYSPLLATGHHLVDPLLVNPFAPMQLQPRASRAAHPTDPQQPPGGVAAAAAAAAALLGPSALDEHSHRLAAAAATGHSSPSSSSSSCSSGAAAASGWCLFVYNLAPEVEESLIWKLFGPFGAVQQVNLVKDAETNKCKGFAFVTMSDLGQAQLAVQTLNGSSLANRILQVSFKTSKVRKTTN